MAHLTGTTVKRGGLTARYWYQTISDVEIAAASDLQLSFSISANGRGGTTVLQIQVTPEDFPTLIETMVLVDRQAAMEAMATEMSRQIATQPKRDQQTFIDGKKEAASLIQQKASDAYQSKPYGEDGKERLISVGVRKIISELKI